MRFTKTLKGRIAGITTMILGGYLFYLGMKIGILVFVVGLGFLIWRFK